MKHHLATFLSIQAQINKLNENHTYAQHIELMYLGPLLLYIYIIKIEDSIHVPLIHLLVYISRHNIYLIIADMILIGWVKCKCSPVAKH